MAWNGKPTSWVGARHPLVNTATLVLSREAVARFVALTGHRMHLVKVQEKE